eukprot:4928817-Pyramimonas_sp.AAC.2
MAVHALCFGQLVDVVEAAVEARRVPVDAAALQRAAGGLLGRVRALVRRGPDDAEASLCNRFARPPARPAPRRRAAALR